MFDTTEQILDQFRAGEDGRAVRRLSRAARPAPAGGRIERCSVTSSSDDVGEGAPAVRHLQWAAGRQNPA